MTTTRLAGPEAALRATPPVADRRRAPTAGLAYYLAFLAVLTDLADAWLYPQAGANTGGIKFGGLRLTDELCVLSLMVSIGVFASGRLRVPAVLAVPLGLASWVWLQGLAVGVYLHNDLRISLAECHVLIYVAALTLAWLQAPPAVIRRHEKLLVPLALVAVIDILPSTAQEKAGDLSTIAAAIAAVAVVRYRSWWVLPLVLAAGALVVTGGQRAAFLTALPPLLIAAVVAIGRQRWTPTKVTVAGLGVAAVAAFVGAYISTIDAFVQRFTLQTFARVGKVEAASSRQEQWSIALHQISQAPLFGYGVGHQYQLYDPNLRASGLTDITHNIYLDVALRFGLVGAGLLAVLLGWSGVRVWRARHRLSPPQRIIVVIVLFLLAHGFVESVLDKPRLMLLAAWLIASVFVDAGGPVRRPGYPPATARPTAGPDAGAADTISSRALSAPRAIVDHW